MDKEASSSRLRSPLSSIGNLLQPTSEEEILRDNIDDTSVLNLTETGPDSIPLEYLITSESPRVQTAREVHLTPLPHIERENIREPGRTRSRSLDTPISTQLDSIQEVPARISSLHQARHSQSRSLDEEQLSSRVVHTSSDGKSVNRSSVTRQQAREASRELSESASRSFDLPRNSPTETTQYHIPLPPPTLRERLNGRPSSDQLLEQRRNSTVSGGTIGQADNGRVSREVWQAPRSDNIGIVQSNSPPLEDTTSSQTLNFRESGSSRPKEPISQVQTLYEVQAPTEAQAHPEAPPKRGRWKRV